MATKKPIKTTVKTERKAANISTNLAKSAKEIMKLHDKIYNKYKSAPKTSVGADAFSFVINSLTQAAYTMQFIKY